MIFPEIFLISYLFQLL